MSFDAKNYLIKEKLPEWWKNDLLLEPINQYTQELVVEIIGGLLNNLGVVQPIQVWKELPEEYNWVHQYYSGDDYLGGKVNMFTKDTQFYAYLPNTKRQCHAIIKLSLLGNQDNKKDFIDLTIKNGLQEINFTHISNMSDIEINTETHEITINGLINNDLVNGFFDKIQPIAKNTNYDEVDIYDENKITQLEFIASETTSFDLNIELLKPVYTTEQHIRLHSVSAFPLEWVRLFGFYCHDFNNKEGYKFVWEKKYPEDKKIVFDKIAKQYDFERFYIQVKFKGVAMPLYYGFPQEPLPSNSAFALNENLDKWGKIYGLPRRIYKDDISEDEEPFTFPKYYNYPIEQDYWYEQRLVNEYRYNEDAINATFIKDTELNNIAILESIDPFINDVWVYTESIVPESHLERDTPPLPPYQVQEIETSNGVSWEYPQAVMKENIISEKIILEPMNNESLNHQLYQTKVLDLKFKTPELPTNVNITGIELKLNAETNIHSEALKIDNRSKMILPFFYTKNNGDKFTVMEEIDIDTEIKPWRKGVTTYTIGSKDYLFNLDEIKREQIKDYLHFTLGFRNESDFLQATLLIHTITAKIYYTIIPDTFSISTDFNTKEVILSDSNKESSVKMKIHIKNKGKTIIDNKNLLIVVPPELKIVDDTNKFTFNLNIGEAFIIGDNDDEIVIEPRHNRTGRYDVLTICDDKVIKDEILVRKGFE